jgi:lipopolysaccharide assembly outer membrane protein LptD (OstA)
MQVQAGFASSIVKKIRGQSPWQRLGVLVIWSLLMKERWSLRLVLLFLTCALACQAQLADSWEVRGLNGGQSQGETIGSSNYFFNGVVFSNSAAVISAQEGMENALSGVVVAVGDVTILDHGHIWRGTNFYYNGKTGDVWGGSFKTTQMPFSLAGENLNGGSNKVFFATNAIISTDDYDKPAYTIHARQITIVPGVYFEARHATLYVGKTPIFYWPYYRRSLTKHPNNFEFVPGERSIFGPYLLSAYNWYGTGLLDGTVHVDYRERRGVAAGPDLLFHGGDWGEAAFRYYYARDIDPGADGITAPHLKENRQHASFFYEVHPATNITAKVVANYQSDPLVVRDFWESQYEANEEPASFAEVSQAYPNWVLNSMAQPQAVDFFETVERLPDVKLTGLRQEVGVTPIYYESENSIGYFRRAFSDTNAFGTNYSAGRADTFHQLTLPETLFGWLNVTPRIGGRATYYTDVDGPAIHTNEQTRGVFNTGVDFSFKASRIFRDAQSSLFDVNELRHIVEPEIDYGYVPAPNRSPSQLPQFDYQYPTVRLLPIEFPEYNSIDSIGEQNVLRLRLVNKLQTKREDGIEDLVNWDVYTDWNLTRTTNYLAHNNFAFSDVYSDLDFRPRSWITFNSSTAYDLADARWREAIERVVIKPTSALTLMTSYYYLMNDDPEFQTYPGEDVPGHNLITFDLYYRCNENWAARISEQYEAQDGAMQQQLYTLYRDLRSWTAALTFRVTQGPGQPTDFSAVVTFSLKAFPRYGLNRDNDRPSLLLGSASTVDWMDQP